MKPTIDFIYFDLGNVLALFDHETGCEQVSALTGVPIMKVRDIIFGAGLDVQYETGKISSRQFVDTFADQSNTRPDADEFLHAASNIFTLNREIVPLITQLRAISFPMGILSNTCEAHWHFLSHPRFAVINECFEKCILSYESKSMKPDGKIYADAAALAQTAPDRILFVDDRDENVQGAINAGFDAHIFTSAGQVYRLLAERGIQMNL